MIYIHIYRIEGIYSAVKAPKQGEPEYGIGDRGQLAFVSTRKWKKIKKLSRAIKKLDNLLHLTLYG